MSERERELMTSLIMCHDSLQTMIQYCDKADNLTEELYDRMRTMIADIEAISAEVRMLRRKAAAR